MDSDAFFKTADGLGDVALAAGADLDLATTSGLISAERLRDFVHICADCADARSCRAGRMSGRIDPPRTCALRPVFAHLARSGPGGD